jgi:hypothetical protein
MCSFLVIGIVQAAYGQNKEVIHRQFDVYLSRGAGSK